ncbi:TraB/GumN family protein [Chitinilyticum piscinae]|uniref:TraB/GumN family protein n=1 Tax=Chitinilyticum piscinae TaxID=2866724 RepID=A0A8J7K9A8_9NEIS|nr:TraB/GumN family protein [Chitinilyticum piscinae]MBE9610993.1 TraB/GumN family protein [Chitinilyticum piscinae]
MLHRFRPWLLAAVSAALLAPAASFAAPAAKTADSLLWKIEKKGLAPTWVYGIAYVSDTRATSFSPAMKKAFMDSKLIGTEVKLDFNSMMEMGKAILTPEPSLAAKMDPKYYARLVPELDARGYPEVATAKMKPWGAIMLLLIPKKQTGQIPMDLLFSKMAIESQKDYFGLESMEETLKRFESIPEAKQIPLLYALIDQQEQVAKNDQTYMGAYLKQQIEQLPQLFAKEYPQLPATEAGWYDNWRNQQISGRAPQLAERIGKAAEKGDAFIGIGAQFLGGEAGVIQRLRKAGYKVTAVK